MSFELGKLLHPAGRRGRVASVRSQACLPNCLP